LTFISVFCYWCINYIAAEIEMPFGDDPNDLPVAHLQESMNQNLVMLMQERCKTPPEFQLKPKHWKCEMMPCPFYLITDVQHRVFGEKAKRLEKVDGQALRNLKTAATMLDLDEANRTTSNTVAKALGGIADMQEERKEAQKAIRVANRRRVGDNVCLQGPTCPCCRRKKNACCTSGARKRWRRSARRGYWPRRTL